MLARAESVIPRVRGEEWREPFYLPEEGQAWNLWKEKMNFFVTKIAVPLVIELIRFLFSARKRTAICREIGGDLGPQEEGRLCDEGKIRRDWRRYGRPRRVKDSIFPWVASFHHLPFIVLIRLWMSLSSHQIFTFHDFLLRPFSVIVLLLPGLMLIIWGDNYRKQQAFAKLMPLY